MDAGQTALVRDLIKSNQNYVRRYEELRHSITHTQLSDTQIPVLGFNVQDNLHSATDLTNVASNVKDETDSSHLHHFVSLFNRLQTEVNMPSYQIGSRSRSRIQKYISNAQDSEMKQLLRFHGQMVCGVKGQAVPNHNPNHVISKTRAQSDGPVKLLFTKQANSTFAVAESRPDLYGSDMIHWYSPPRPPGQRPQLPKRGSAPWHPWLLSPLVIPQGSLPISTAFLSSRERDSESDEPSSQAPVTSEASVDSQTKYDAQEPTHRNEKVAQAGLAGAAVAGLVGRARSVSRDRQNGRERSKSRVRLEPLFAAASLRTGATAALYERSQANSDEEQDEEKAKAIRKERRKARDEARSRFVSPIITPEETLSLKEKAPKQEPKAEVDQNYLPWELQSPMRFEKLSTATATSISLAEHWPSLVSDATEDTRAEVSSDIISPEIDPALNNDAPALLKPTHPSPGQTPFPSSDLLGGPQEPLPDVGSEQFSDSVIQKRARNTIAARKSRQRKSKRYRKLEEEVTRLSTEMEMWKNRAMERSHVSNDGQVMQDNSGPAYNEGQIRKAGIAGDRPDWAEDDDGDSASQCQTDQSDQNEAGEKELAELLELWTMGYKYAQTQKDDQHMKPYQLDTAELDRAG